MRRLLAFSACLIFVLLNACKDDHEPNVLILLSARMGQTVLTNAATAEGVVETSPVLLQFSSPVARETVVHAITLTQDDRDVPFDISFADAYKRVQINMTAALEGNTTYLLSVSHELKGSKGEKFAGASFSFKTRAGELEVLQWTLGENPPGDDVITNAPLDLDLRIQFGKPLSVASVDASSVTLSGPSPASLLFDFSDDNTQLIIRSSRKLRDLTNYTVRITDALRGEADEAFAGFQMSFYTMADPEPDFPLIADDALLTLVQEQTFKYFWDFAHPVSGMARERNTSGDIVTSGGSGFGIMALIVGIERGFISRAEGLQRMDKILTFLEGADRFHGAWPHWMNGNTGDVIPFSTNDNGGDLVETSFLIQGLLTFRQYLDPTTPAEQSIIGRINQLWESVEWDWYTRGEDVLYWHWSPDKQWIMNHPIRGYNEALITYFLAAASPTHPVSASVYHKGWANDGAIINNKGFYGITLPLGFDYGGPLFFAHYSFLGLDPRNLMDMYANYWTQNVNHARINHAYSVENPKKFVGYSDVCWGLTASDNHQGYSAHSPTNDLGVVTPTAALSSFPYTPDESMKALKFFYYTLGDRLWGAYGFYDAFNITQGWTADSYLAIDQGPIIIMIENYRTGLLWDLFMSSKEVGVGMDVLGFTR